MMITNQTNTRNIQYLFQQQIEPLATYIASTYYTTQH